MESNSQRWSLAVWLEDDMEEEGVIPSSWITEETVKWPRGLNAIRAMKEMRMPDSKWDSFQLVKVKFCSDSKQECEDYNLTTTAEVSEEEEEEVLGKRRPKKKVMEDFISEIGQRDGHGHTQKSVQPASSAVMTQEPTKNSVRDSNKVVPETEHQKKKTVERSMLKTRVETETSKTKSAQVSSQLQLPKPPPGRKNRDEDAAKSGSKNKSSSFHQRSYRCSRSPSSSPSLHGSVRSWRSRSRSRSRSHSLFESSRSSHISSTPRHRSRSRSRSQSLSSSQSSRSRRVLSAVSHRSRSRSPSRSKNRDNFPMSTARFQKRVLYLLTSIRDSLRDSNSVPVNKPGEGMKLQKLKTIEELENFEDEIGESEAFASLKMSLSKIGGVTAGDHTRKAMEKLLHNSLMAKMNVTGKKGKYAFGRTQLFKAIMESVSDSHTSSTEASIQEAIMKYLKYAPERSGGGGRNAKEAESV